MSKRRKTTATTIVLTSPPQPVQVATVDINDIDDCYTATSQADVPVVQHIKDVKNVINSNDLYDDFKEDPVLKWPPLDSKCHDARYDSAVQFKTRVLVIVMCYSNHPVFISNCCFKY